MNVQLNFKNYPIKNTLQNKLQSKSPLQNRGNVTLKESQNLNSYGYNFLNLNSLKKINTISFGSEKTAEQTASNVAKILYKYRKPDKQGACQTQDVNCPECSNAIKSKILPFVEKNEPISMVLVGFPFKSPSRSKCIGTHPDKAEEISLKHLRKIVSEVEEVYKPENKPGAKIDVYSDNLAFSMININPSDEEARTYVKELEQMAKRIGVDDRISFKTIDNADILKKAGAPDDLNGKREWLLNKYGQEYTEAKIKQKMKLEPSDPNFIPQGYFNGLKRFNEEKMIGIFVNAGDKALKEKMDKSIVIKLDENNYVHFLNAENNQELDKNDEKVTKAINIVNESGQNALTKLIGPSQTPYVKVIEKEESFRIAVSKAGQRQSKEIAYDALQISKAWGNFINEELPDSLRLSSHPQPCGSQKIGIFMTPNKDEWTTSWQSCAAKIGPEEEDYVLTKVSTAEDCGCKLVHCEHTNKPSHYEVPDDVENKEEVIKTLCEKK